MQTFRNLFIVMLLGCFSLIADPTEAWKEALEAAPAYPEGAFSGRGIVIPAGGETYLINAWVNVNMLRHNGCKLPIEIWYIGEEEIVPKLMKMFKGMGVKCCDVTHYFDHPIRGWEVKPHAAVACRFEEVLLLDADNVTLSDPTYLFDTPQYRKTGAVFWPDVCILHRDNKLWEVLELEGRDIRAQESGQVLLNKRKCWEALQLCVHMNKESAFYYDYIYGDKDTFILSWLTTETSFHMVDYLPGLVFRTANIFPFSSLLQRDCEGEPLFCHTVLKHWGERTNFKTMWHHYTQPEQRSDDFEPIYPYRAPTFSFRKRFGDIEKVCLHYFKQVQPGLPLCKP